MSYPAVMADWSRVASSGLLAAVWQGMVLAGVVWLGLKVLPKTPAAVRFVVWLTVFVVVAGLPSASLWHQGAGSAPAGGGGAWLTLDARWSLAIAAVWAFASLVRAATLVVAAVRVRTLWKRATPVEHIGFGDVSNPTIDGRSAQVDYGAPGFSDRLSGTLRGTRRALICTSYEVDRPTVIGFFAPKILIPTWLLEKLTAAELEQIVLHETGHLVRADDWINLLQKIALVVVPLNPALAWVERRLCFERELACDERVLRTTQAPKAYAACLATLAEHRLGRRGLVLALGALGRESELGRRVGKILKRGDTMRPFQAKLVLGGAVVGLLSGAVGLERCPQIIGFTAASVQAASAAAPGSTEAGRELGYKTVVFHASPLDKAILKNNLATQQYVSHEVTLKASTESRESEMRLRHVGPRVYGMPSARAIRDDISDQIKTDAFEQIRKDDSERGFDRSASVELRPMERTSRVVQWLVVTEWMGENGSRLVFTTARTSTEAPRIFSDVSRGSEDALSVQQQGQQSEEVYPYAAVPVRGGWLVFQL